MLQDLSGQMIGHYQVVRPIEQGGMATVYLANDIHLQRQVAIKAFQFASDQERNHNFFQRFTREAQVVARLDHPNIVLVHDYGEQDNLAYLVMPYFAQGSLKQLLQTRGLLPITEALRITIQLLDALQYAHERGLIHRDIKPGNILFKDDQKDDQVAVLADFGLVKETLTGKTEEMLAISTSVTQQPVLTNGALIGTPYYMAPEQVLGQVQSQSDIYSIGLVLYEMLTGSLPFAKLPTNGLLNILYQRTNDPPLPIRQLNATIPLQLEAAIMRSLEKDVALRYQRASEFAEALRHALQQHGTLSLAPVGNDQYTKLKDNNSDQDLNSTLPDSSVESALPLSSAQKSSHLAVHAPTMIPSLQPLRSQRWHIRRFQYLLSGLLLAVLLLAFVFADRPLFLSLLHSSSLSQIDPTTKSPTKQLAATVPMPKTVTSCPAVGTARPAVLAPYGSQGNNVVIYSAQSNQGDSTLMSYDPLTGKAHAIVKVKSLLANAQLSANGQWVIFSTYDNTSSSSNSMLQMVRVDGQGLQTLYCSTSGFNALLASPGLNPQQGWPLFFSEVSTAQPNSSVLVVLDLSSGKIEQRLTTALSYQPIRWESDQSIYLLKKSTPGSTLSSIVQLSFQADQSSQNATFTNIMTMPASCADVSFSTDNSMLYRSSCQMDSNVLTQLAAEGPSTLANMKLAVATDTWSNATTFYTSSTLAIIEVRAVTPTKLLLIVSNGDTYSGQNGLWEINTDGSGLQRLYSETEEAVTLNRSSEYPWSNVSSDGERYAFKVGSSQALGNDQLFVGTLSGGQPKVIAADGVGDTAAMTALTVVGWTTV